MTNTNQINIGDTVKCFVTVNDKNGTESQYWASGVVYHITEKIVAFEAENGHIYGVRKEAVELI